MVEEYSYR